MKIISESTDYAEHYASIGFLMFLFIAALALTVGLLITILRNKDYSISVIMLLACYLGLSILLYTITYKAINEDATTTYTVKIEDVNKVYDNGYEIVGEADEGLFLIRKVD